MSNIGLHSLSVTQGWALHAPAYNSSSNSGDCFQNSLTLAKHAKHTCLSSGVVPALWHRPCENVTRWEFTAVPVAARHSDNSNTVRKDTTGQRMPLIQATSHINRVAFWREVMCGMCIYNYKPANTTVYTSPCATSSNSVNKNMLLCWSWSWCDTCWT